MLYKLKHKSCEVCGKELILRNDRDIMRKRFCSKRCLCKATMAGNRHFGPNLNARHPHEITQKLLIAAKKRGLKHRGENSPFYRNGSTPETRLRTNRPSWRTLVAEIIQRDNYTCQKCGTTDCRLAVHHVIPWVLTHSDSPMNLITLCQSCHAKEELGWTPILVKMGMRKEFTNAASF